VADPGAAWVARLTVGDLLTHRSGLGDYGYLSEYHAALAAHPEAAPPRARLIDMAVGQGPRFSPGEGFSYSNVGYALLTELVERRRGRSFGEALEDAICRPLGLASTRAISQAADLRAVDLPGYGGIASREAEDVRGIYDPGWVAHGLVSSTVADLNRFMLGYVCGRISASLAARIGEPIPLRLPGEHLLEPHYGLGVMGSPKSRWGRVLGHEGGGPGYGVACYVLADRAAGPVAVTVVVNDASRPGRAFELSAALFHAIAAKR
jgi:D-alanyl-D-alanine carboxypeptidase